MDPQAVPLFLSVPYTSTLAVPGDSPPQPPTTFLSLPAELRHEVYTHIFVNSTLSCGIVNPLPPCRTYTVCTCVYPSQITQVNRQLREETLPLLHAATTLQVQGPLQFLARLPSKVTSSITRLVVHTPKLFRADGFDFHRLSALRTIEVRNVIVWCKFYDEVFLESEEADPTMLGMAQFNLRRVSRELTDVLEGAAKKARSFRVLYHCQFVVNSLSDETIHALIDVDGEKILSKMRGPPEKNLNLYSGFY